MPQQLLPAADLRFIVRAAEYLENPGFLIRIANMLGQPLEAFAKKVPDKVKQVVENALRKTMQLAIRTVPKADVVHAEVAASEDQAFWSGLRHTVALTATGAAGGMFGLTGLAVELPVSMGILFRSVARIAGDFGEDLSDRATRLECLSIFSYSGSSDDEAVESTYLTTRFGMTVAIQQAGRVLATATSDELAEILTRGATPAVVTLLARIAARFDIIVSEKVVAQTLPVVGALGGSVVNAAFSDHFNSVARYHFGLRMLERRHGAELIQGVYREAVRQMDRDRVKVAQVQPG